MQVVVLAGGSIRVDGAVPDLAATAALASFVNGGGVGTLIAAGFGVGMAAAGGQVLAGGVLAVAPALLGDAGGGLRERRGTPRRNRQAGHAGGGRVPAGVSCQLDGPMSEVRTAGPQFGKKATAARDRGAGQTPRRARRAFAS